SVAVEVALLRMPKVVITPEGFSRRSPPFAISRNENPGGRMLSEVLSAGIAGLVFVTPPLSPVLRIRMSCARLLVVIPADEIASVMIIRNDSLQFPFNHALSSLSLLVISW